MRRKREPSTVPPDLADPVCWPQCVGFDGKTNPCICWFSEQQQKYLADGGEWPGGDAGAFADYLKLCQQFDCRAPFDPGAVTPVGSLPCR